MKSIAPLLCALGCCYGFQATVSADVVINEINYDPEPKTDLAEYIELLNTGESAVDLSGWTFSNGIGYTFPEGATIEAGAFLILAQNVSGYQKKYGSIFVGGLKAFGEFATGSLANEGERIVLRNAANEIVDEVNYQSTFPWPIAPQGEAVQENGDGVSMELLNPALDNDLAGSWRAGSVPTPGKVNSVFAELTAVPPHLRQVEHSPKAPRSGEAVTITVKATDPDGVASVTLSYQHLEPGAYIRLTDAEFETTWTELPMLDDGVAPDEVADDGVYAVTMPDTINQHRHLVRYRIHAADGLGNELRVPYADDPQPNFAYFVYDGVPAWTGAVEPGETAAVTFSEETMNSIAVYHLIATNGDIEAQQWGSADREWYGTVVYEDEVYDHITFSKRGRASRGQVGKEKWDWNFNRGHRFQARDNYGDPYGVKWREINVLPGTNPWWRNNVSTDGTILNESVGFRIFQLIGSPASNTSFFQMRVIDDSREAPNDQYEGDLWGLYIAIQDPDSRFLEERGLADGNIYNWHSNGDPQKNQGATSVSDGSDQSTFKSNLRANTELEWWQQHLNYDAYFAFNCGNLIVNNSDMRPNENMMSYYHPDGQCYPIPWDLDLTFEDAPHLGRGDTPAWENIWRVLNHDEVDLAYQNRIRELLSLLFNGEQGNMLVDEYSRFIWIDVPQSDRAVILNIEKDGSRIVITTPEPHGYETDDLVTVEGVEQAIYNGDKVITKVSETVFTYKGNIFSPAPTGSQIFIYKTPDAKPLVLMDQAMWDHHPRKRKKGIYYENIEGNDTEDFKGYQAYMKAFIAPGGYGYDLLASHADESKAPETPTITYVGAAGYSVSDLSFEVSEFDGGSIFSPQEFAAVQWRLAETTNCTLADFDPTEPRVYEIDGADWQSEEIAPFVNRITIPEGVPRPGRNYSVRARMKNTAGHWSLWSDSIQFVAATPDIAVYTDSLVISEIMYNPRGATTAERELGYSTSDFEYVELVNVGDTVLDLTQVRFTKGIDFDFAGSAFTSLEPNQFVLVVSNAEAFAQRYPGEYPIAGVYEGRLSNGGERLKLSYGAGTAIRDFEFDDGEAWPQEADGGGHALLGSTADVTLDLNDPASWSITAAVDGSPGFLEPDGPAEPGDDGYAEWAGEVFSEAELADAALSGPMGNFDGDAAFNWVEYALGSDPKTKDVTDATVTLVEEDQILLSHGYTFPSDVDLTYERSADLQTWETVVPAAVTDEAASRQVRFPAGGAASYLRLRLDYTGAP